jgi:hypothetical protein
MVFIGELSSMKLGIFIIAIAVFSFIIGFITEKPAVIIANGEMPSPGVNVIHAGDGVVMKAIESDAQYENLKKDAEFCWNVSTNNLKQYSQSITEMYSTVEYCRDQLKKSELMGEIPWSGCEGKPIIYTVCEKGCDNFLQPGVSMLPFIDYKKKLGFCRVDELKIGDIVAVKNPYYPRYDFVLHRVVGFNGTKVITQGYNNDQVDTYQANFYDVLYELGTVGGAIERPGIVTMGRAWFQGSSLGRSSVPITGFGIGLLIILSLMSIMLKKK